MVLCYSEITGTSFQYNTIPTEDQQAALSLLAELAVQRGTLSAVLDIIRLLLNLWTTSQNDRDNRLNAGQTQAPLVPLLHRFHVMYSKLSQSSNNVIIYIYLIYFLTCSSNVFVVKSVFNHYFVASQQGQNKCAISS